MRAGITFSIDLPLKVGTLAETITVSGDSPMIEMLRGGSGFPRQAKFGSRFMF